MSNQPVTIVYETRREQETALAKEAIEIIDENSNNELESLRNEEQILLPTIIKE